MQKISPWGISTLNLTLKLLHRGIRHVELSEEELSWLDIAQVDIGQREIVWSRYIWSEIHGPCFIKSYDQSYV